MCFRSTERFVQALGQKRSRGLYFKMGGVFWGMRPWYGLGYLAEPKCRSFYFGAGPCGRGLMKGSHPPLSRYQLGT